MASFTASKKTARDFNRGIKYVPSDALQSEVINNLVEALLWAQENVGGDSNDVTNAVTSVNDKTGDVHLSASDVGAPSIKDCTVDNKVTVVDTTSDNREVKTEYWHDKIHRTITYYEGVEGAADGEVVGIKVTKEIEIQLPNSDGQLANLEDIYHNAPPTTWFITNSDRLATSDETAEAIELGYADENSTALSAVSFIGAVENIPRRYDTVIVEKYVYRVLGTPDMNGMIPVLFLWKNE